MLQTYQKMTVLWEREDKGRKHMQKLWAYIFIAVLVNLQTCQIHFAGGSLWLNALEIYLAAMP